MKFSIIRSKFLDSLKNVQNIVAGKASLQILQNVRIEAGEGRIILTTTDLSITVKASAECDIAEPGATTLPVRLLFLTVSKMSEGIVTVEVDASDRAVVSGGSAVFKISGLPERDFPKIEQEDDSFAYTIPQPVLREMLRKTHYAASTDETRRNLQGVLFSFKEGKLTMVATDGRRLALVENEIEIPAGGERDVILSTRSIVELLRILGSGEGSVTMYLRKTQVHFDFGEIAFSSKGNIRRDVRQGAIADC